MESVHSSYSRTRVTTGGKRACTCALSGIENAVARNAKHRRQASGRGEKWSGVYTNLLGQGTKAGTCGLAGRSAVASDGCLAATRVQSM